MEGLKIPEISTFAAHALREMCDKCKTEMTPNFDGLLEVHMHTLSQACDDTNRLVLFNYR